MNSRGEFDAIVVGAGFGGVQMLHEFTKRGMSACGIEGASDVGGAWYWNRYPGARCDVESYLYAYSFCPELDAKWQWSERYPPQAEIQRYIATAADLWDVRKLIRFDTWVKGAAWDEQGNFWEVTLDSGEAVRGRYLVMAVGPLTKVVWPDIPGIDDFKGERYHTARWPGDASLAGKRIGVIGNGSSGTQFMTEAAKTAGEIHAFMRTPHYSVPAFNRPLTPEDDALWRARHEAIRAEARAGKMMGAGNTFTDRSLIYGRKPAAAYAPEEQRAALETYWEIGGAQIIGIFADVMVDDDANSIVGDFVRDKVRSIVTNPPNRDIVVPRHFAFGGKRLIVDTGFYEIFNQPNVFAHDLRANPIVRITEKGVETTEGETELDMLVCATGFEAVAGSFNRMDIRGRGGITLNDHWQEGAKSYLGLVVHDFPNMFMVNGPGAPGPFSNVVVTNEWCIETIMALIEYMREHGHGTAEADRAAEDQWMDLVHQVIGPTFFAKTDNWYSGQNVTGKRSPIVNFASPTLYREKIDAEKAAGFPNVLFGKAAAEG